MKTDFAGKIAGSLLWIATNRQSARFRGHAELAREALQGGADCIEFSERNLEEREFIAEALKVKGICDEFEVPLIIRREVNAAVVINAAGVHLDEDNMSVAEARGILGKGKVIAQTVTSELEAKVAAADEADYLVADFNRVAQIRKAGQLPVIAAGGIHAGNISKIFRAGADKILVMRAVMASECISDSCRELKSAAAKAKGL